MTAEFTYLIPKETTAQIVERSRTQLLDARAKLLAQGRSHTIAVLDIDDRHVADVNLDPTEADCRVTYFDDPKPYVFPEAQ